MSRTSDPDKNTVSLSHADSVGEASTGSLSIVVFHRDGAEVALLGRGRSVIVGRAAPADLIVPDAGLSRQHARFFTKEQRVWVEDLDSTNGTFVEGRRIETAMQIEPGAKLALGGAHAVVQAVPRHPTLGLDSHDQMVQVLEHEIARARHFQREVSLLIVRAADGGHASRWLERVQAVARPIDRLALYSAEAVEVLLVEMPLAEATAVATTLSRQGSHVAVGNYPGCATTANGLIEACRRALRKASSKAPVQQALLSRTVLLQRATDDIVAESAAMKEVLAIAKRLARGTIPVLLHGETGTGKEVISRFIHDHGVRSGGPMVAVNCAAIPPQLVESTLFGHTKGAFTGATQAGVGVFESAHGGTVLLDEIGELPAAAQAALLRVLETKRITRVGSTKEVEIDVRIMAATHRDLEAMAGEGAFRADLLYRLNALTLALPPLRDRRDDVPPLVERFLAEANEGNGRALRGLSPEALAAVSAFHWPGNVRELRNVIERAVVIADHDIITLDDLPQRVRAGVEPEASDPGDAGAAAASDGAARSHRRPGESFRDCIERIETNLLLEALREADGNQSAAARILNMPRRTLINKMNGLGIKKRGYGVD